ncbi:MAG: class I SAM-dependent methyltransferase [Acidobacteriaceae bacterium]
MEKRSLVPDAVEHYVFRLMSGESEIEQRLRQETAKLPHANMQIGPDQAALMAMLVRTIGVRRALEIGTFTGYSAFAVASALPQGGELICCDISKEWTDIARRYWKEAGLDGKIQLRLGAALETLAGLLKERGSGSFDFAFIDADKPNYDGYYELCLRLVRPGGLILLDNVLWHGEVVDPATEDAEARMFRALNEKIRNDPRVEACLLTIGDGIMVARKLA